MQLKNRWITTGIVGFIVTAVLSAQLTAHSGEFGVPGFAVKPLAEFVTDFEKIPPNQIVASIEAWVDHCIAQSSSELTSGEACIEPTYQEILEGLAGRKSRVQCLKSLLQELEPATTLRLSKEETRSSIEFISVFLGASAAGMWAYKSRSAIVGAGKALLKGKKSLAFEEPINWGTFDHASTFGGSLKNLPVNSSRWNLIKKGFLTATKDVEEVTGKSMSWFYKASFLLFVGSTVSGNLNSSTNDIKHNLFDFILPENIGRVQSVREASLSKTTNPLDGLDHIDPKLSLRDFHKLIRGRDAETRRVSDLFNDVLKSYGNPDDDPFYYLNLKVTKRASHVSSLVSTLKLMNDFEENVILLWGSKVVDRCQQLALVSKSINQTIKSDLKK
ncbi:MAG: hypothetical protein AABZ55_07250 [Bdellovibrionota bacterium]